MHPAADSQIAGLHAKGLTGSGIRMGHLDTGVDGRHPALAGAVATFVRFDRDGQPVSEEPSDSEWHGTHTAGIVCGVAPRVRLCSAAVIHEGSLIVRILAGLDWMLDQGVRVLLMPFGLSSETPAFDSLLGAAREHGILIVVPVGNGGAGRSRTPGNRAQVLSVGAVDEHGRVAKFSGSAHRPGSVQCMKPDVVAPGVGVVSAAPGGGVMQASGTSMAAAFVAGVAALLFEARSEASVEDVEAAIVGSALPVSEDQSHRCAAGLIQPRAALEALLQGSCEPRRSERTHARNGDRYLDARLARELAHSAKDVHVEAVVGGRASSEVMSAISRVCAELGEEPRRMRQIPRGGIAIALATRSFIERLIHQPEVHWASAPLAEEWTLVGSLHRRTATTTGCS